MENFIILTFPFISGQDGWVFEVLALVDIKNSLGHKLIKQVKLRTNRQDRKIKRLTLWFRLRSTNNAQLAGGMCKSRLSANTSSQSFPKPSFLPEPSFLLTESTWLSELP